MAHIRLAARDDRKTIDPRESPGIQAGGRRGRRECIALAVINNQRALMDDLG